MNLETDPAAGTPPPGDRPPTPEGGDPDTLTRRPPAGHLPGPTHAAVPATVRVGRLEPAAISAVMARDIVMFKRYWRATTFSSVVQPVIYLLAFGLGFGSLVHHVGHFRYVQYVATGVVATAVLFSSAFPGMFNTFVRWRFQRTYDALLAAPIDAEELVTAETLWIAIRSGVYGVAPLVVGFFWGLTPEPAMLLVPFIGLITGFGFANFGVLIAAFAKTIDNFNYVTSAVLTPMFLVAGTFFPITQLPGALRTIAQFNPLYHCVALVRDLSLETFHLSDLLHLGVLVIFALLLWRLATTQMQRRLID
ncbi:ABC transporter permease [Conexibacter sp. DBS9H8]|uniref:ABC transporter permease n=1 Tax=Conexibacter sp. DBS9H8 TaxID=2937801 RepID=UPI00200E5A51|nr:ABC transporter permease [Conexibacter sp. DBS9H8]